MAKGPSSPVKGLGTGIAISSATPSQGFAGQAGKAVAEHLLKNNGVRVNDGAIYGGPEGCRINLACPEATMKEGLRRIAEGLDSLIG